MREEIEKGVTLTNDARLGKAVKLLAESERRGYDVIGKLESIIQFKNGDEVWEASYRGFMCRTTSRLFELLEEVK